MRFSLVFMPERFIAYAAPRASRRPMEGFLAKISRRRCLAINALSPGTPAARRRRSGRSNYDASSYSGAAPAAVDGRHILPGSFRAPAMRFRRRLLRAGAMHEVAFDMRDGYFYSSSPNTCYHWPVAVTPDL